MERDASTQTAAANGDTVPIRRFTLRVVAGPQADRRHISDGPTAVIGTHASADFVVSDPTVSRFHCRFEVGDGRVVLRDLGSKNGTRVNGVRVIEAVLEGPATIALGRTEVEFDLGQTYTALPLSQRERFGGMVGRAPASRAAFAQLERAAASDVTVLLHGETGTGKEVAAEAIHNESARASGPFVVVDCGAIPHNLIDSELFGHERGAFTGADRERRGAFELASGGTIFLDEIGELDLDLQPRLLGVLERREVCRVGGTRPIPVDVRIVSATHRDLRTEVNAGRFRPDLFYRLAVLEVRLPPLRERLEDLPILVEHLLEAIGARDRTGADALLGHEYLRRLSQYAWPGNIRELRNYVERSLVDDTLAPAAGDWEAPPNIDIGLKLATVRAAWIRWVERRYIQDLLERHGHNMSAAARAAGIDRTHLYRIMASCGLR